MSSDKTKGRLLEGLVHGVPMYPFSQTPDGRIVKELNEARRGTEEFQRRALEIQQRTAEQLAKAHGGVQVIQPQQVNMNGMVNAFGQMTSELRNLYSAETQTAEAVGALNQVTEQGLHQIHRDLSSLQGPSIETQPLSELLNSEVDVIAALGMYGKGTLNEQGEKQVIEMVEKPLQDAKYEAESEMWRLTSAMSQDPDDQTRIQEISEAMKFLSDTENILKSPPAAAYRMRLLNGFAFKHGCRSISAFTRKTGELLHMYTQSGKAHISESALVEMANSGYLSAPMQNRVMEHFPQARKNPSITAVNYNLADILKSSQRAETQRDILMAQSTAALGQREAMLGYHERAEGQRGELIEQGVFATRQRAHIVFQGEQMLEQGNIGIGQRNRLIELEEGQLHQGEVMIDQLDDLLNVNYQIAGGLSGLSEGLENLGDGLNVMNQNLGIGIEQGNIAIQQRDHTNYNLRQIIGQLMLANAESADFHDITRRYFEHFSEVLEYHGALARNLTNEVITTKLAVVTQIRNLQQGITQTLQTVGTELQASIEWGNNLLDRMVALTEDGLVNKAYQYYRDGKQSLVTAENTNDLQDAYEAFCKGIKELSSSVENHFGAGITAEMLGNVKEAKDHYDKAGKRATEDQAGLASKAYESKAKIEHSEGNIEQAMKDIEKAIQKDLNNISARSLEVQYLIEKDDTKNLAQKIAAIVALDELAFSRLASEPLYLNLPTEKRREIVETVWSSRKVKSPQVCAYILQEMMEVESGLLVEPFRKLLILEPQILIQKEIWLHPKFNQYRKQLVTILRAFFNTDLQKATPANRLILEKLLQKISS